MDFWDSLLSLKEDLHGKDIIIAGYFNTTKSSLEKRGGSIIRDSFGEKLEDTMVDLDLLDPMPKNGKFTWSNKRAGSEHIAARLDRFLVSTTFLQKDLLPSSHIISSATSDHKPILLSFSLPTNLGPIPFTFNPLWLNNAKTLDIIHTAWNFTLSGSPSYIWESLLSLKADLHGKEVSIARDFNTTKSSVENRGGLISRDSFGKKLEDLIAELDLLDHMPKNGKFTWTNK